MCVSWIHCNYLWSHRWLYITFLSSVPCDTIQAEVALSISTGWNPSFVVQTCLILNHKRKLKTNHLRDASFSATRKKWIVAHWYQGIKCTVSPLNLLFTLLNMLRQTDVVQNETNKDSQHRSIQYFHPPTSIFRQICIHRKVAESSVVYC